MIRAWQGTSAFGWAGESAACGPKKGGLSRFLPITLKSPESIFPNWKTAEKRSESGPWNALHLLLRYHSRISLGCETTLRASAVPKGPFTLPGMLGTGALLQGQALEYTQTQKSPDASPGLSCEFSAAA
jgi:hypothetical protein